MSSRVAYELRSDTFTVPTKRMRRAILEASEGDDVYMEDESTFDFLARICSMTGKESALFAPSGTMANQVLIRSNLTCSSPTSIVCDYRAHVYRCEAAGLAVLSQAIVYPATPTNGKHITLENIEEVIVNDQDIYVPVTRLICLENTISGVVIPVEEIKRISEYARSKGIRMHLDGARLWEACAKTGVSMEEYCQYFDTISICVSKGLGAPVGSVMVGDKVTMERARWIRKQQGGGMRQVGPLAAAANVAIDEVWPTMSTTHQKVAAVADIMEKEFGYVFQVPVQTNFIFIDTKGSGVDLKIFLEEAKKEGLKVSNNRLAFHHQLVDDAYDKLVKVAGIAMEKSRAAGFVPVVASCAAAARIRLDTSAYAPVKEVKPVEKVKQVVEQVA